MAIWTTLAVKELRKRKDADRLRLFATTQATNAWSTGSLAGFGLSERQIGQLIEALRKAGFSLASNAACP